MTPRTLQLAVALAAFAGALTGAAQAQPTPQPALPDAIPQDSVEAATPDLESRAQKLAGDAARLLTQGNLPAAEKALRDQLKLQPGNFVVYYNLACARAMQNDPAGAGEWLVKSVEHGFSDIYQLRRDPTLRPVREDANYRAIVEHWPAILEARRDANLKGVKTIFKTGYAETRDEALRVIYLSAFDAGSTQSAVAELSLVARWCEAQFLPGLTDPAAAKDDAWAIVVLPSRADYEKWATLKYGVNAVKDTSMIAGAYDHDLKRLVSMDLGATLRHEFLHLLHWRMITRTGQTPPIWIMEGLGSVVEDYDARDGMLVPAPSWRTNISKRVEGLGNLPTVKQLADLSWRDFQLRRPLLNYAASRTVFMFLAQRGQLRPWADAYAAGFADDPSGLRAMETATGLSGPELQRELRTYVKSLPAVAETIKSGMASLGIDVDAGTGEGPVVAEVPRSRDGKPHPLRLGDVLTAIDGKPVRDLAELVRVLSGYKPGDVVEVSYRRGRSAGAAKMTLDKR